ncbi:MAG: hypothetical protein C0407_19305, partial [Desulfobacca sp.]|nr:hypothetical protein [Desulfobacca sp.]
MGKSIPILAYHHVNSLIDDMVTVSVTHFEDQMAFLQMQGFTSLFISETVECLQEKRPLPSKPVAITFDDGFRDNFQFAFPLLKKFKIKATIFVVTGWMGEQRDDDPSERIFTHRECKEMVDQGMGSRIALTWQEVKDMEESGLVQVEAHGHRHIKDLYRDIPALKADWRLSQESFLEHLKRESRHL